MLSIQVDIWKVMALSLKKKTAHPYKIVYKVSEVVKGLWVVELEVGEFVNNLVVQLVTFGFLEVDFQPISLGHGF